MIVKYFDDSEATLGFGRLISGDDEGEYSFVCCPDIKAVDILSDGNFTANTGYNKAEGKELWRLKFQTQLVPLHNRKNEATVLGYTALAIEIQVNIDAVQAKLDAIDA